MLPEERLALLAQQVNSANDLADIYERLSGILEQQNKSISGYLSAQKEVFRLAKQESLIKKTQKQITDELEAVQKRITYGTKIEGYLPILISQCNKLDLNLKILGEGKKWEGFFQRTLDFYDFLKKLDPNEICIFIDGYDTIPLEDEKEILKKYNSFNKLKAFITFSDSDPNLESISF
jgi:hypothetical protein